MRLALLLPAALAIAAGPAGRPYTQKRAFSVIVPADAVAAPHWEGRAPTVDFILMEKDGRFLLQVTRYQRDNPFHLTAARFEASVQARAAGGARSLLKSGGRDVAVYRGLRAPRAAESDFEPDLSALGRLRRCRTRGAWQKYAWYRDVHDGKSSPALFAKYWTADDDRLIEACLGQEKLEDIKQKRAPDRTLEEPDDARLAAMAHEQETRAAPGDRAESVSVRPTPDGGFYVLRYEAPEKKAQKHDPAFVTFVETFTAQ